MQAIRRVSLAPREVPGLVWGALRGDPVALRRILGARRTGRTGLALALVALVLAAPSLESLPLLVGLHLVLGLYVVIPRRGSVPVGALQEVMLSLWTVAPLLAAFAALRLVWPTSLLPAVAAVVLGHLLVWRALRDGLR